MKIVIAGSSGLIGSALVRVLRSEGDGQAHQVVRLVRREATADDEIAWDPSAGRGPDLAALKGVDAAINLAGVGVGDHRWTDDYKWQILQSRVSSTELLVAALRQLEPQPRVLLSGSAIGYYGETGDTAVDEDSHAGND
ncbi:MAG TPA: NAD-dependent epimerase/dehydratase family protein, partial [Acidothermaceae bacterium]